MVGVQKNLRPRQRLAIKRARGVIKKLREHRAHWRNECKRTEERRKMEGKKYSKTLEELRIEVSEIVKESGNHHWRRMCKYIQQKRQMDKIKYLKNLEKLIADTLKNEEKLQNDYRNLLKKLAERFKCKVCFLPYNDTARTPMVYPCGHTACSNCAAGMLQIIRRVICPFCRREVRGGLRGFRKLRKNFEVLDYLKKPENPGFRSVSNPFVTQPTLSKNDTPDTIELPHPSPTTPSLFCRIVQFFTGPNAVTILRFRQTSITGNPGAMAPKKKRAAKSIATCKHEKKFKATVAKLDKESQRTKDLTDCLREERRKNRELKASIEVLEGEVVKRQVDVEVMQEQVQIALEDPAQFRIVPQIECEMCTIEYYDTTERAPRLMECGHSVCGSCIAQLCNGNELLICPYCRSEDVAPYGPNGFEMLPKNYSLLDLIRAKPRVEIEPVVEVEPEVMPVEPLKVSKSWKIPAFASAIGAVTNRLVETVSLLGKRN